MKFFYFLFFCNSTYSLYPEHWIIQQPVFVLHLFTCHGRIMPRLAELLSRPMIAPDKAHIYFICMLFLHQTNLQLTTSCFLGFFLCYFSEKNHLPWNVNLMFSKKIKMPFSAFVIISLTFTMIWVDSADNKLMNQWWYFYSPGIWSMLKGYIVFVCSVRLSIRPGVIPSVHPFYNQVLLRSFLITYNSAAADQTLFIFGIGVPGRVLFHSTSMDPRVMPLGRARDQNLGHPNKVVYCSLIIQTKSY